MDVDILENYCIMGLFLNWTFPLDTECRFNVLCTLNLHTISKGLAIDTLLYIIRHFQSRLFSKQQSTVTSGKTKSFYTFSQNIFRQLC